MSNQNNLFQDEKLFTRAAFSPQTLDESARTVEVVFGTETPVRRNTWDGAVEEILQFDEMSVRLDRLNAGAPVLDNHDRWGGAQAVVGVVERAYIKERKGYAVIRFAKTEEGDKVMGMVKDGILRNVSVGYAVHTYTKEEKQNAPDVWRATDWEPYEVSIVPVPADATAQIRQHQGGNIHNQNNIRNMVEDQTGTAANEPVTPVEPQNPPPPPPPDDSARAAAAALVERNRVLTIQRNATAAGLSAQETQLLIDSGASIEQAATRMLETIASRVPAANGANTDASASVRGGDYENMRTGMAAAILLRGGMAESALTDAERTHSRQYRALTLREMAREVLEKRGENVRGLTAMEIVSRAFTSTSDFPVLLENVMRQSLLAAYMNAEDVWRGFCSVGSLSDFRTSKRKRTGAIGNLPVVYEDGEYPMAQIPDGESNSIYLETYGQRINVSRQMIINDDLSAFTRLPADLARAAARTIEAKVFAVLAANPTMTDGNALFSSAHGNLVASGSGGVITVASVDAIRQLMAAQKDPASQDFLNIRPAVVLCSLSQGGQARVVNDSQYDVDVSSKTSFYPNKSRGTFNTVIDTPRLTGNGWYAFADPNMYPTLEVAFLDGVQTPRLEMQNQWETDGTEYKISLDFGVAPVDYRGAAFNFGS